MSTNKDRIDETLQPKHIDYALGALDAADRAEVERNLTQDEQTAISELRRVAELLEQCATNESLPEPSASLRQAVLSRLEKVELARATVEPDRHSTRACTRMILASSVCLLLALLSVRFLIPDGMMDREMQRVALRDKNDLKYQLVADDSEIREYLHERDQQIEKVEKLRAARQHALVQNHRAETSLSVEEKFAAALKITDVEQGLNEAKVAYSASVNEYSTARDAWTRQSVALQESLKVKNREIKLTRSEHLASRLQGRMDPAGAKETILQAEGVPLLASVPDVNRLKDEQQRIKTYVKEVESLQREQKLIRGQESESLLAVTPRIVISEEEPSLALHVLDSDFDVDSITAIAPKGRGFHPALIEAYEPIVENSFVPVAGPSALSTFSIDVDTASYSNMRRYLRQGQLPPPNAVRIEELVNYFQYDYPQPQAGEPFSVSMEVAECPWKPSHQLLRVGLKGRDIPREKRPPSNLVFLIDVSGSMGKEDKLPLLKESMKMLVAELDERDRVTIVTYAGEAGLQLEPTSGDEKIKIREVIDGLKSGGSTHGSAGIELAYAKAAESFIGDGTNRVLLATDGDLNVGITDDDTLVELIKDKAASGVFLTVLGFGTGNLQDGKLEKLADNGNGMYAYVDSRREGRRVLVEQIMGSLVTIAKDVKIQIEFNPATVGAYRLIGYENRVLAAEDFDNDEKDAGEIGAGHTVTALYELVPAGVEVEGLKYQSNSEGEKKDVKLTRAAKTGELLTLALRYKKPAEDKSKRIEFPLKDSKTKFNRSSKDFQFAAAVASFGMLLRNSEHCGSATLSATEEIAGGAIGKDPNGYRAEFLELVRKAEGLAR